MPELQQALYTIGASVYQQQQSDNGPTLLQVMVQMGLLKVVAVMM